MFLFWLIIAMLSTFYVINSLRKEESEIHISFNMNYEQAQRYTQHYSDLLKELKYITENRLANGMVLSSADTYRGNDRLFNISSLVPLVPHSNCNGLARNWRNGLLSVVSSLRDWRDSFFTAYDINRLFLIDIDNLCMVDFGLRDTLSRREQMINTLRERVSRYRNTPQEERDNSLFWITQSSQYSVGYFYAITPVWLANRPHTLLGTEQVIRVENLLTQGNMVPGVTILDNNGHTLLSFTTPDTAIHPDPRWVASRSWFGYSKGFKQIILKKSLPPSNLNVVYSLPVTRILERIRFQVLNAVIFNLLLAALLFALARMFEKRLFIPAENDAQRMEEHEQFNRKIVAYAPVGICILRIPDGANILCNELAHNYLNMLTHEDKQRLVQVVRSQQVNVVDVLTSNNTHLQISFVHSRYRNENVAICVLVDVSERVKMEQSLHEIVNAAEQANQAKSMFLATVSHELRTPLYGIIGNLDLLRAKPLSKSVERLVNTMSNSSSLLLKIISDILDFSKIESEQLKIEPLEFSPREVISHITANYLPLLVRKRLVLYCFIDPGVPASLNGDAMRLQQVISNLLSNAIKFTGMGCIIMQVGCDNDYLTFRVRDTGVGIPSKELTRLFEPFFQVGNGVQHSFQGTGLGLAICEKLINMMDGDIEVTTAPGIGSEFAVRIPLYHAHPAPPPDTQDFPDLCCWLMLHNTALYQYLKTLLEYHNISMRQLSVGDDTRYITADSQDILICDDNHDHYWAGRAQIRFCYQHIGAPVAQTENLWIYSTASPHEIISQLRRIYHSTGQNNDTTSTQPVSPGSGQNNGDMLILVVDDHPINRQLLSDQLALLGYQCVTAHDGVEALEMLEKMPVDIVLTDVNMPNMDGYILTRHIRQSHLILPVIGVTANALAEEKQRCLNAGMNDCLSKPITLALVQQTLACYANKVRESRKSNQAV